MLKNQSNAALQNHYWFLESSVSFCVVSKNQLEGLTRIQKVQHFIEQCPLKIVKINVEAF